MEERKILRGLIDHIIFRNDETGYTVAVLQDSDGPVTVVGFLPHGGIGQLYALEGSFVQHAQWGMQFQFDAYEEVLPETEEEVIRFLQSGLFKGLGAVTAKALVDHFGADVLQTIEEEPNRLTEVKGIGLKTAASLAESYRRHQAFARTGLALQKLGLTTAQALKIFQMYGVEAPDKLKENPYLLVEEVRGYGFLRADQIAKAAGLAPESPFRIDSGLLYTLRYYLHDGHTYLPQPYLEDKAAALLDQPRDRIREGILRLAFDGKIKVDSVEGGPVVYLYPYYAAEQEVAGDIFRLRNGKIKELATDPDKLIDRAEEVTGIHLSSCQREAVKQAATRALAIITGGPGTGKTTIIKAILTIFEASGIRTALAAPTGRAAKRITETAGREAKTIHRLLEYHREEEGGSPIFGRNAEHPLEYEAVIIDEASMIDLLLMRALTDALPTGTRLLLIGDKDQLPPVAAGHIIRDLLEADILWSVRLTEIFRQTEESLIALNAHRINEGDLPALNRREGDFYFLLSPTKDQTASLIRTLSVKRIAAYLPDLDPIRDIQVLTPVKKGSLGTDALNKMLQQALNPPDPDREEKRLANRIFRVGDKVMQIRNDYDITWKSLTDFTEGSGVFNGDIGYVADIDKENGVLAVVFDEDHYVSYPFSDLDELELAYAITVHKSQGSEFPVVIMPMADFPPMLATRNLLYTAVTRARRLMAICGSLPAMERMIHNNRIQMRYSGLRYRLQALESATLSMQRTKERSMDEPGKESGDEPGKRMDR